MRRRLGGGFGDRRAFVGEDPAVGEGDGERACVEAAAEDEEPGDPRGEDHGRGRRRRGARPPHVRQGGQSDRRPPAWAMIRRSTRRTPSMKTIGPSARAPPVDPAGRNRRPARRLDRDIHRHGGRGLAISRRQHVRLIARPGVKAELDRARGEGGEEAQSSARRGYSTARAEAIQGSWRDCDARTLDRRQAGA